MFYRKSIDVLEATGGDSSAQLSSVYNNLAGVYSSEGQYLRAIELIRKSESINRNRGDKTGLASNYYSLAVNFYYLGDWGRSKDYLEACIRLREEVLGPDHYRLAAPTEVLGIVYEALRDFDKNILYLKKALVIKREVFGDDHPISGIPMRISPWATCNPGNWIRHIVT